MRLLPLPCGIGDLKRFGARGRSEIFIVPLLLPRATVNQSGKLLNQAAFGQFEAQYTQSKDPESQST
jgi:hypothetical protein